MNKLIHYMHTTHVTPRIRLTAIVILLLVLMIPIVLITSRSKENVITRAATSGVIITGVAVNNSSAKIDFQPVPGAVDYRVYDVANPTDVKYAGIIHVTSNGQPFCMNGNGTPVFPFQESSTCNGPTSMDVPFPEIEWNGLGDRLSHTLLIEAVNQIGPVPKHNLYNNLNQPLFPLTGAMLGSNKGPTDDGNISTNGQGPYANTPQVLATSQPFIVQASSSISNLSPKHDAVQTFYDTFDQSEASTLIQTVAPQPSVDCYGKMAYTLNNGTSKGWDITTENVDGQNSMPFIMSDHFMDVIFDGGSQLDACGHTMHQGYGDLTMHPQTTADFSNGKLLHITTEVDMHVADSRRWMSFFLSPANDPITEFHGGLNNPPNKTGQQFYFQTAPGGCAVGYTTAIDNTQWNGVDSVSLEGALGQAINWCHDNVDLTGGSGSGFDNRSRLDFFLTTTHFALFEDGQMISQGDIVDNNKNPATLPFSQANIYFNHYIYHSEQEMDTGEGDLSKYACYPMNAFWFNNPVSGTPVNGTGNGDGSITCPGYSAYNNGNYPAGFGFKYSDERHWDNMGFEVLPASDVPGSDWSSLASLVKPQSFVAPVFVTGSVTQSPSPTPCVTNCLPTITPPSSPTPLLPTPTLTLTPTSTLPTNTPIPSPTATPLPPSPTTIGRLQGDLNPTPDGKVCIDDLSILSKDWGRGPAATPPTALFNPLSDINGDGIVNVTDLSILAKNWKC